MEKIGTTENIELQIENLQLEGKFTFESTFSVDISFVLADFLTVEELFTKFCVLNRNFKETTESLKEFKKIWTRKFLIEFASEI